MTGLAFRVLHQPPEWTVEISNPTEHTILLAGVSLTYDLHKDEEVDEFGYRWPIRSGLEQPWFIDRPLPHLEIGPGEYVDVVIQSELEGGQVTLLVKFRPAAASRFIEESVVLLD